MSSFSLLVSCCFVLPLCFCLEAPNCTVRENAPCEGVVGTGSSVAEMLFNLDEALCGCVYVSGSIRISVVTSWPDATEPLVEGNFSFLFHVREIRGYLVFFDIPEIERLSLPNLRLIRGEKLFNMFALSVLNSYIKNLYMPKLTEITNGNAFFSDSTNPSVCNLMSVDWTDILSSDGTLTNTITGCTGSNNVNCNPLGCDNCWCEDSAEECCQIITKDCDGGCSSGRCTRSSGNSILCCDDDCAAGCTGGTASDCNACVDTSVFNEGTCQTACPPRNLFDQQTQTVIMNPDFRFEIDGICVKPCPDGTFELISTSTCVDQCPEGSMSVPSETSGMECMDCEGICPKECQGGISSGVDINCTIILGDLRIANPPSEPDKALSKLNTIQHITGSLSIEVFSYEEFPYLSNLETIGSDPDAVESFPCDGLNSSTAKYSIYITGTQLVSIDLSSLREISGGGVSIDNNPDLCFVGDFGQYLTDDSSHEVCIGSNYRKTMEECVNANLTCHPQCDSTYGCWGPRDTQCVSCLYLNYEGRCVQNCIDFEDLGVHLYTDVSTKECELCDELCEGACTGEGPTQCTACSTGVSIKLSSGGMKCINDSVCPLGTTYNSSVSTVGSTECLNCSSNCSTGCTGPLGIQDNAEGCVSCQGVILNSNGTQEYCFPDSQCPDGYFNDVGSSLFTSNNIMDAVCTQCHRLCSTCTGSALVNCTMCKFDQLDNGICAVRCPIGMIHNDAGDDCISPVEASNSEVVVIASVIPVVIVVLIVVLVIMLGIFVVRSRRQQYKLNLNDNNYRGLDREQLELMTLERETLQPPLIAPNAAKLVVTPEDSLEFGKELGAGAFGTVYEGYWRPDNDDKQYHVAIKVLKNTSPSANKELLQEGVVMGSMDHDNVVRLYCVCMSKQLMLVSQYVPLGALVDYLKRHKDNLSAVGILQFSSQIALGMAYLETKRLVHRDLAARNVLVQSHRKVKITDFGLTRIVEADQDHYEAQSAKMPVRWLPPESIRHRVFTHKTDVWSFGVTVWEILTFGARPYQGKRPYEILKQIEGGRRLEQPMTCTIELYGILLECWLPEPESRPSFDDLHQRLRDMLKDPSRYVLTVKDGSASDYGQLPSNENREGETIYEQPFAGDVSIAGTLPSNVSSIDPYRGLQVHQASVEKGAVPFEKQPQTAYEMPIASPKAPENPRYVKLNVGQAQPFPVLSDPSQGYDSIDKKKLQQADLVGHQEHFKNAATVDLSHDVPSSSAYETPEDGKFDTNNGAYQSLTNNRLIEDHYDMDQSYSQPTNSKMDVNKQGIINEMYDSSVGVQTRLKTLNQTVPPDNDYEVPEDPDQAKQDAFVNPVYDTGAMSSAPPTHNYELVDEDGNENTAGMDNLVYDSTVGATVPPIGNYEVLDEEDLKDNGFHNATYDSTAINNVPHSALHNPTYDSAPPPSTNRGDTLVNATYDSRAGVSVNQSPRGGLINATYGSSPAVFGNKAQPPADYEDIDEDLVPDTDNYDIITEEDLPSTPFQDKSGNVPPTDNYEEIGDVDNPANGFINDTYDSTVGGNVPPTDNYEEIGDVDNPANGFINDTYDSTVRATGGTASPYEVPETLSGKLYDGRNASPYEVPGQMDSEPNNETIASPYEMPAINSDYELPHDGAPGMKVYDVPSS